MKIQKYHALHRLALDYRVESFSVHAVFLWYLFQTADSNLQVVQDSVMQLVNQTMDSQLPSFFPCFLNNWDSGDVLNIVLDV